MKPFVIGIAGGSASGKTTVAQYVHIGKDTGMSSAVPILKPGGSCHMCAYCCAHMQDT